MRRDEPLAQGRLSDIDRRRLAFKPIDLLRFNGKDWSHVKTQKSHLVDIYVQIR
jgi:hypothetical protein